MICDAYTHRRTDVGTVFNGMLVCVRRFFSLVSQPGASKIVPFDFMPFLEELLAFHPGLAFLETTPEFQVCASSTVLVVCVAGVLEGVYPRVPKFWNDDSVCCACAQRPGLPRACHSG